MAANRNVRLLSLPEEVLSSILRHVDDEFSRQRVFRTCKGLATALVQHAPTIELTYPSPDDYSKDIDEYPRVASFLSAALQTRKHPLQLTLQPDRELLDGASASRLAVSTLGSVELCPAVDHLILQLEEYPRHVSNFPWKSAYSASLAASFPGLTSLTLRGLELTPLQLELLVTHPLLVPRLQQLDISQVYISNVASPHASPFAGSRLQQLTLGFGDWSYAPHLAPLTPYLTRLRARDYDTHSSFVSLVDALSTLTCLQWLDLDIDNEDEAVFSQLLFLAQLPVLHTLVLEFNEIYQEQLDVLLALSHVTHLQVLQFSDLPSSRANAACSWRWLEVLSGSMDFVTAAHLPLHSLTYPLHLKCLHDTPGIGMEDMAEAELNLCERNTAGVEVGMVRLSQCTVDLLAEQHCGNVGSSTGEGGWQEAPAGGRALMQRLGRCVEKVSISTGSRYRECLSVADESLMSACFPSAAIYSHQWVAARKSYGRKRQRGY